MSNIPEPTDCVGNVIRKGDLVAIHMERHAIGQITAVEGGGIHTSHGVTPASVRLVIDMNIVAPPGRGFHTLVKIVRPDQQKIVESMADALPRG